MKHMNKAALLSVLVTSLVSARPEECRTMQMNLGPTVNFARYKFDCTPEMQGAMVGLHFDWQHNRENREFVQVRFDGRWSAGDIKGCNTENRVQDYRPEFNFGWNFTPCWCDNSFTFTPIVGLGFFFLSNELSLHESSCNLGCVDTCATSTGCSSSDENRLRYFNFNIPVGLFTTYKYSDCLSIGLNAEYRIDAVTRLRANEDCKSLCSSVKPNSRTQGVLVEMPFNYHLGDWMCMDWQMKFVPLFDWNRFGSANCECNDSCSSTCNPCESTSSCPDCVPVLDALANCATDECHLPSLTSWYIGAHIDLGIRF